MNRKYNFGTLVSQPVKNTISISYLFLARERARHTNAFCIARSNYCHGRNYVDAWQPSALFFSKQMRSRREHHPESISQYIFGMLQFIQIGIWLLNNFLKNVIKHTKSGISKP